VPQKGKGKKEGPKDLGGGDVLGSPPHVKRKKKERGETHQERYQEGKRHGIVRIRLSSPEYYVREKRPRRFFKVRKEK